MREKLLHFPCVSRIHSTSERKNPPDFRWEGAKCEFRIKNEIFFDDGNEHTFVINDFYSVLDALEEE